MTIRSRIDAVNRQLNPPLKLHRQPSVTCLTHLHEDGGWQRDGQPISDDEAERLMVSKRHDRIIIVRDVEERPIPGSIGIERSYGHSA